MTDRHDSESDESYAARVRYAEALKTIKALWSGKAFPQLPLAVRAENMLRECQRDKWQMAPHPILRLRGNDHG